ncbi:hypothetical protein AgCh_037765 [Apium graveolens]
MANAAQLSETSEQKNIVLSPQQLQQLLSMMPGNCGKDSNYDEADSPFSGMINSGEGGADNKRWIVDSGASDHMTARPGNSLQNGLKMMNVLDVPDFNHNLLSIHKLAKDNNCDIMFYPDKCMIIDATSKQVETQGTNVGNAEQAREYEFGLWHHRLGHTPAHKLQLIPHLKAHIKDQKLVCITCPMAKFTKLSFKQSESQAIAEFELLHIDTWGPYRVCSRGKYRYFLTLVDDFPRFTWVYLLQNKSDYLGIISAFLNYVKNHFNKSIKFIRSDNALEFIDKECKKFYAEHGIIHQTSCVFRPQQNARVERKHRQILEVARSLMITPVSGRLRPTPLLDLQVMNEV